jgi:hypothetical protein
MLIGDKWFKGCFICHGKGHHLSHNQVDKVKETCYDVKKNRINWKCVERKLQEPNAVCELCHGEKLLFYPHI